MAETTTEPERLVNAYVDVWNERNYARIPDLVSESFAMYDPAAPGGEVHGRDGLAEFIRGVVAGFPDFHVTVVDVVSDGGLVMYEGDISMTHEGEFDGIPPTGRTVEIREMSKFHVADDEVQEHRAYFDQQAIFEQLGLSDDGD